MATRASALAWPIGLAALLAVGLGASLAFAWVAARLPADQLPLNPWTEGDAYNVEVRAREAAQARGWDLALRAERFPGGVHVELVPTSSGEPLPTPLEVGLRRERPDRADLDGDLALAPSGTSWVADVPLPIAGRWLLVARAGDAHAWVERRFALEVPP